MNASDARKDLIVGSPGNGTTVAGRVHIIFGGPVRSGEQSLSTSDVTIVGLTGDRFGAATAAGNVKTTETSGSPRELVVGAPNDSTGGSGAGAVYLFQGFTSGSNLTTTNALLKIVGSAGEQFGSAIATADLNKDGYREILVLAPGSNRIYVFNGGASVGGSPTQVLTTGSASSVISGRAFRSLAAGDLNGDGLSDVIVGAPFENSSAGESYILFGQQGGFPAAVILPTPSGVSYVRFDGANPGDLAGAAFAIADFDDDKINDLFIGAPGASPAGRSQSGVVYVAYGRKTGWASSGVGALDTRLLGAAAGARLGTFITTGDINRDTPNDVVMLAAGGNGGQGELDVYYGAARNLRTGTIDLANGMSRRMFADPSPGPLSSAIVFEVTGEGARDVIVGSDTADGGPGTDSGLLYFSISPKLVLTQTDTTLKAAQGSTGAYQLVVTNPGAFTVTWMATTNAAWLTVSPASSQSTNGVPGVVTLTASSKLAPGIYTAVVTVHSTSPHLEMSLQFNVTFVVRACSQTGHTPGDFTGDGCADLGVFTPSTGNWTVQAGPSMVWGAATDILTPGDYNGDGVTDIAIFRPSNGTWYVPNMPYVTWGVAGDVPVPADYDGDKKTDIAVFRARTGTWYIKDQATVQWGRAGDIPVPADYNGDGRAEIAVFRRSNGNWYFYPSGAVQLGLPGDIPVPADYNGDGKVDVAVFRPSTGQWIVNGQFTYRWGQAGDIPVPMDRNGDGSADLAVYRPSTNTWFIKVLATDTTEIENGLGSAGDVPVMQPWRVALNTAGDFDGDGRADVSVFRPSDRNWYTLLSSTGNTSYSTTTWGLSGDITVPADYDGDGRTDTAIFRPSTGQWWMKLSSTQNTAYDEVDWGASTDTPVPGDYTGSGVTQVAIYRPGSPSRWYIRGGGYVDFGFTGDIPTPADYDGDGRTDIAVFRPSTGMWYVSLSSTEFTRYVGYAWGTNGDKPVAADYDGDGKADLALFRPSNGTWYILTSSSGYTTGTTVAWGLNGDVPVPADYDADGKADVAVFRPSDGRFYIRNVFWVQFGQNGDVPTLHK